MSNNRYQHHHNISVNSINSINSLIEPTTPPNMSNGKSVLWETNKLNNSLHLPNFSLDNGVGNGGGVGNAGSASTNAIHRRQSSNDSNIDKENSSANSVGSIGNNGAANGHFTSVANVTGANTVYSSKGKIDKDYLLSINKVPLANLKQDILKLSKDQYGCRFLQKKIDENLVPNYSARYSNFEIIFKEIYPNLYELIIDPFGNYLIQKLVDYCNEININLMLEILQYNLFQISINQHGTRALQKIIDNLSNSYQLGLLIKGLKPYIIELIKDLNGNHVIQKVLNKYSPENCQFIYDSIVNDLYTVATHKHGCCVLQKCLNHVTPDQLVNFSDKILNFDVFMKLINDQFGNYVLQYLISIDSIDIHIRIYQNFISFGVSRLCNLKFSSNVIEKFLKSCFKNEVLSTGFTNLKFDLIYRIVSSDINKLINDPYGNYVIQTLIDVLVNNEINYTEPLPECLLVLLPPNYQNMNVSLNILIIKNWFQNCKIITSFGKRIQSKINTVLNGTGSNPQVSKVRSKSSTSHQNMNANGEFVVSDNYQMQNGGPNNQRASVRSMSFSSSPAHIQRTQGHLRNSSLGNGYYPGHFSENYIFGNNTDMNSASSLALNGVSPSHQSQQINVAQQHNFLSQNSNPPVANDYMINDFKLQTPSSFSNFTAYPDTAQVQHVNNKYMYYQQPQQQQQQFQPLLSELNNPNNLTARQQRTHGYQGPIKRFPQNQQSENFSIPNTSNFNI